MNRKRSSSTVRIAVLALGLAGGALLRPAAVQAQDMTVYKTPWCGCCGDWVEHVRAAGFNVVVKQREILAPVKRLLGVPESLQSCHTAMVEGYAIEGHVPAADIHRLLAERPQALGLAVPGMPIGSPGMEQGGTQEPYDVILFGDGAQAVYARH